MEKTGLLRHMDSLGCTSKKENRGSPCFGTLGPQRQPLRFVIQKHTWRDLRVTLWENLSGNIWEPSLKIGDLAISRLGFLATGQDFQAILDSLVARHLHEVAEAFGQRRSVSKKVVSWKMLKARRCQTAISVTVGIYIFAYFRRILANHCGIL